SVLDGLTGEQVLTAPLPAPADGQIMQSPDFTLLVNGTAVAVKIDEFKLRGQIGALETGSDELQKITNEVQTVTLAPVVGGLLPSGTFTLGFEGQTTGPIPAFASAFVVQNALSQLSTIGAGNVFVTTTAPG